MSKLVEKIVSQDSPRKIEMQSILIWKISQESQVKCGTAKRFLKKFKGYNSKQTIYQ